MSALHYVSDTTTTTATAMCLEKHVEPTHSIIVKMNVNKVMILIDTLSESGLKVMVTYNCGLHRNGGGGEDGGSSDVICKINVLYLTDGSRTRG